MSRTLDRVRDEGTTGTTPVPPADDAVQAAKTAGLRWVSDTVPGISRKRRGKGFAYVDTEGRLLQDPDILARIRSLAIPPAWTGVWISPVENGHLQATGRDSRERKQYLYHPRWREVRDQAKYEKCIAFGRTLPRIRRRIAEDLSLRGMPRNRVLAAVVQLLDATHIRIGNDEYARANESFGLTTIHNHHAEVNGTCMYFEFKGKSGVEHRISFCDPRLSRIVEKCQDLPGQELFAFIDDNGEVRDVTSTDVNDYLHEVAGEEFTAKDFRTWAGTALAAEALWEFPGFHSKAEAKRNVNQAIDAVAERLGNTRAICRKCYIHPTVLEAYLDGSLVPDLHRHLRRARANGLSRHEAAVLALLEERLDQRAAADKGSARGRARRTGKRGYIR